ncbi:hypothetical protein [Pectobacterium versatile]|uniref:hypothetical protein n=1 Tax=Pectobacterium versatile TaxID=2488639 RepID=UPI003809C2F5
MKNERRNIYILLALFILFIFTVVGTYVGNFNGFLISKDPADWGVLGDYIGGILNPLISMATLFFLIKTYLEQKNELQKSENSSQSQREIITLQIKISTSSALIGIYREEIERVTNTMNTITSSRNGLSFTGIDGKMYFHDHEQKNYRLSMASKIEKEFTKINEYLTRIDLLTY